MRLKSHQQQLQQQQSTNQRLKTNVTITIIILVVVVQPCLLATTVVAAVSSSHPAAIQIGDPKQRIPRQVAEDDKARDDSDCDTLDGASYHKPHFTKGRSVIVELFEWKFVDVAEECRTFLGPKGYGGVQLSPVLEHTVIKTDKLKHPWWQRYETVSYRFASRSGDESEFWSMSRICNDNGVRIYLDVMFNHMAAPLHLLLNETTDNVEFSVNTLLESNVNIANLSYPNVPYTSKHFHRPCAVGNSQSTHEIRNCQLNGHPDLDLGLPSVQERIVEMLNKFIDMGVAGFHVYEAKYVWPNNLKNIYEQLKDLNKDFNFANNSRPFIYHDIFDLGLDSISKTEYATYGAVTEYLYAAEISTILRGKAPLSSLINWGPAMGFLSHQDSMIFIDSPETQRGLPLKLGKNRVITHRTPQKYTMANAMMLVHPYGSIKRIMSSYYYNEKNINQGPPTEEGDEDIIRSPELNEEQQCTVASGWVCEHRWPVMVNLVALVNYFNVPGQCEESVIHFQTNGPNHIAFCRGHTAFVAMNNDAEKDFIKDIFTCLEPGVYCDVITGGLKEGGRECHGHRLEVNDSGYTKLNLLVADDTDVQQGVEEDEDRNIVKNMGVLVVYVGSKIGSDIKKMWEESVDMNDKSAKETKDLESPGLSEEKVDSDAGAEAGEQNLGTNKVSENENEGGGEDMSRDGAAGNPEFPGNRNIMAEEHEFYLEVEISKETDENEDGDEHVVKEVLDKEKILPDNEVKAQESPDKAEVSENVQDNDGANSKTEEIVEKEQQDNADTDASGDESVELATVGEEKDVEDQEAAEDGDLITEDSQGEDKDSILGENQESTKDIGEATIEVGQSEDGNIDLLNNGDGNDNDVEASIAGNGKEVENVEEKELDETGVNSVPNHVVDSNINGDGEEVENIEEKELDETGVTSVPNHDVDSNINGDEEEVENIEEKELDETEVTSVPNHVVDSNINEHAEEVENVENVEEKELNETEATSVPIHNVDSNTSGNGEEVENIEEKELDETGVTSVPNGEEVENIEEKEPDETGVTSVPNHDVDSNTSGNGEEVENVEEKELNETEATSVSNHDVDSNTSGNGEEVENVEEKELNETEATSVSNHDVDSNTSGNGKEVKIYDGEKVESSEVSDLEEDVVSPDENENKTDAAPEALYPDRESDVPDESANLAAAINEDEESAVPVFEDFDVDPEIQNPGDNVEMPKEVVPVAGIEKAVTFSGLDENSNTNKILKESNEKEGSGETEGEAHKESQESVSPTHEPNVTEENNDTEAENPQIEKPFSKAIEPQENENITLEIPDNAAAAIEKINTTIYEIVNNITERLPFFDNNTKAAVKNEFLSAKIFPPPRRQQPNAGQMLKLHSFLICFIIVKMLAFDLDLKKIQFHLMLKPTPTA